MKRLGAWAVVVLVVTGLGVWLVAATAVVPEAPFGIQRWLPLPVACVGGRCITYRAWTALIAQASPGDQTDLLTEFLTGRASGMVARRTGLAIANSEIEEALKTIDTLARDDGGLQRFLAAQYGDLRSPRFRAGLRDVLTRAKLTAAGTPNAWDHPAAPWVVVLHFRYRWDPHAHQVVAR